MTRIAFDATALPATIGGAGNYILQMARHLGQLMRPGELVVYAKNQDADRLAPLPAGVDLVTVDFSSRVTRLTWEQTHLPGLLKRQGIGLVHSPHYTVPLRATGVGRVVTFHDLIFFLMPEHHQWLKVVFFRWMIRRAASVADHIISDSHSTRNDMRRLLGVPDDRVTTIHLAASEAYTASVSEAQVRSVRARYGLSDTPILLTVCTLEPRKNLAQAVRAFAALRRQGHDVQLVVAGAKGWGTGALFDEVRTLSAADQVRLLGYVPDEDLPALYRACTVFLYPSVYEGFGLPPLEAMACGMPVVVSNRSSLPEVVGDGGITYDPDHLDDLISLLAGLLQSADERDRLSRSAVRQAARFSWTRAAENTHAIYEHVLRQRGR